MSPQTVNAYYNPSSTRSSFPAAILQPPFFDPKADPAVNYGAIGARDRPRDRPRLRRPGQPSPTATARCATGGPTTIAPNSTGAADELVDAVRRVTAPLPTACIVNGALTLGENIGDLGGLTVAYEAYQLSLERPGRRRCIDGFTGDQRFFLAWAQVWRTLRDARRAAPAR